MAKKRSRRREWTKDDVRELKTLARQKTPARKIARSLKRTEGATRQKAFSLGISLDFACVSRWQPKPPRYLATALPAVDQPERNALSHAFGGATVARSFAARARRLYLCDWHGVAMTQSTYPASRRAAVLSDFGEAHNFSVREVPTPPLRSDEMLVRVRATSVNPIEWKMRRAFELPKALWRLLLGRPIILGIDFSGTVAAVGPEVDGYRVGDDVMGALRLCGADAEYVVVRPGDRHTAVALKPPSVSYAEAAAVSFAGLVALAGMTTYGALTTKESSRVLIIGASGGVGHLAIQIAKRGLGAAFVVGVCSSKNEEFVTQVWRG